MRSCRRHWCPVCGEEMIHRDNRRPWESASAFGQIMWRNGPAQISAGDVDLYVDKRRGNASLFRLLERFQQSSPMKERQRFALTALDGMIRHCASCAAFSAVKLLDGSGVYTVRGQLLATASYPWEVEFVGPQKVSRLDGAIVLETTNPDREIFDWLNGGSDWTPRKNHKQFDFEDAERAHLAREDRKLADAAQLGEVALRAAWAALPKQDQKKLEGAKNSRHKPMALARSAPYKEAAE